jgi:putative transposase
MSTIKAKKHRLPPEAYYGEVSVSITANLAPRIPAFRDSSLVETMLTLLNEAVEKHHSTVPIYCFMPDHLHLVIKGVDFTSRPKSAMDGFKYRSGLWLREYRPEIGWQDDYYDRKIRKYEEWRRVGCYFLHNPVRRGIVEDPFEYPHTGSIGWDLRKLIPAMV